MQYSLCHIRCYFQLLLKKKKKRYYFQLFHFIKKGKKIKEAVIVEYDIII